jgi:hypothetical protein
MKACRWILAVAVLAAFSTAAHTAPIKVELQQQFAYDGARITAAGTTFTHALGLPNSNGTTYTLDEALLSLTFKVSSNAAAQNDTISLFLGGTQQVAGIASSFSVSGLDVSNFYDIVTGLLSFELFRGLATGGGNISLASSTLSVTATAAANGGGGGVEVPPAQPEQQVPEPGTLALLGLGLLGMTMVRRRG